MSSARSFSSKDIQKAGLNYIEDASEGITRQRCGKGYSFKDTKGKTIQNPQERERLLKIAVPPSYTDIWYCPDPKGHLQATGYDTNGKKQYFYHAAWDDLRDQYKYTLMLEFGQNLPSFRRKITRLLRESNDEKQRLICALIRILDHTGMRIGNQSATKSNKTFGLTTLRKKHISLEGNEVHFAFKGKGGGAIECSLCDPAVINIIQECKAIPGETLFEYHDEQNQRHYMYSEYINDYIKENMGESYSAKDFRTWRFSSLYLKELLKWRDKLDQVTLKKVLDSLVEHTCNTSAILKSSYIHPGLIRICNEKDKDILNINPPDLRGLRMDERFLFEYLKSDHAKNSF